MRPPRGERPEVGLLKEVLGFLPAVGAPSGEVVNAVARRQGGFEESESRFFTIFIM